MLANHGNRSKTRTSPLWQLFKRSGHGYAKCILCKKTLSFKSSITNLKRHLLLKHGGAFEDILYQPKSVDNQSSVKSLINLVKVHPCLWDTRCDSYGNVELQNNAWNEIGIKLYPTEDQTQIATKLSQQFNTLKNGFFSYRQSGYNAELSFLRPLLNENHEQTQLNKENLDIGIKNEPLDEYPCNEGDLPPNPVEYHNLPHFKEENENNELIMMKEQAPMENLQQNPENGYQSRSEDSTAERMECNLQLSNVDEDTLFLLSLVDEMKRIPSEFHMNFKADFLASFNQLIQKYGNQH